MDSRVRPILAATFIAIGIHTHGAWAQPTGGQIVAGTGAITQSGSATVIDQTSSRLAANWTSFSINTGESVRFNQPSASSVALNRVLGQDPSVIMGSLSSNGQVFLLNPHGVLFGRGAQVDVGGLVASTLRLSDQDFLAGRYTLTGNDSTQSVVNQGSLTAANGGYIALIAPQVRNEGTISAPGGTVALAAGNQVTLTLGDHQLVGLTVDQGAMNALAENKNLVQADGGLVILTAKGQDAVLSGVVNNEGIIQARTVSNVNGVIKLLAGMEDDTVQVSGTLDASAPNGGDGGFIETSAAHVNAAPDVMVTTNAPYGKTGTWLVDPIDFTIANSGGDMTPATLASNLVSSNFTIQTASAGGGNGDIFVSDAVTWNSANSLT
ncbi:MAG: filamentous hemagglutinin N-terminal domain-containing protein [Actinomycetota bacterium]